VSKRSGKEVLDNRVVRGFEYQKGRYVIVRDEDLRRASPERTRRIEIHAFTDLREVEPRYHDRPYYLEPGRRAEKSYAKRSVDRQDKLGRGRVGEAQAERRTRERRA
jgi:DNA end-binding protein Ku